MAKILFLCTGNSCRSQIAEAWCEYFHPDMEAFSAGVEPDTETDKRAVKVMAESGIDISKSKPKHLDVFKDIEFDFVITLCDDARENCPLYSGKAKKFHKGFEDPPYLAKNAETEEEAMVHYRRIRDEIKVFISSAGWIGDCSR